MKKSELNKLIKEIHTILNEASPKQTYEQLILDDMTGGCERIIDNINIKIQHLLKQQLVTKTDKKTTSDRIRTWTNIRDRVKKINGEIRSVYGDIKQYETDRLGT